MFTKISDFCDRENMSKFKGVVVSRMLLNVYHYCTLLYSNMNIPCLGGDNTDWGIMLEFWTITRKKVLTLSFVCFWDVSIRSYVLSPCKILQVVILEEHTLFRSINGKGVTKARYNPSIRRIWSRKHLRMASMSRVWTCAAFPVLILRNDLGHEATGHLSFKSS